MWDLRALAIKSAEVYHHGFNAANVYNDCRSWSVQLIMFTTLIFIIDWMSDFFPFFEILVASSSLNTASGASRFGTNSTNQSNGTIRQQQTNSNTNFQSIIPKSPIQLTDMPLEIFEKIFKYTGYKEVSNMRLVR